MTAKPTPLPLDLVFGETEPGLESTKPSPPMPSNRTDDHLTSSARGTRGAGPAGLGPASDVTAAAGGRPSPASLGGGAGDVTAMPATLWDAEPTAPETPTPTPPVDLSSRNRSTRRAARSSRVATAVRPAGLRADRQAEAAGGAEPSSDGDARRGSGTGGRTATARASQRARARVRRLGFSAPAYLGQAHHALAEAVAPEAGITPGLRYVSAHLAALRCAAAVLAVRGRPARRRAGSAWVELAEVAPELEAWAALFTESADLRATAEAGLPFPVGHRDVDAFCRVVGDFVDEVERLLHVEHQSVLPTAS